MDWFVEHHGMCVEIAKKVNITYYNTHHHSHLTATASSSSTYDDVFTYLYVVCVCVYTHTCHLNRISSPFISFRHSTKKPSFQKGHVNSTL